MLVRKIGKDRGLPPCNEYRPHSPQGKIVNTFRLTIAPRSAFGTRLLGDTLFGQLCWAVRNRHGEARLQELLEDYRRHPYAVISDAFPHGFLPRPALPGHWFDEVPDGDRKAVKKRAWLPLTAFHEPVTTWLRHCQPADGLAGAIPEAHPQPHNTIDRVTGTTGTAGFAPYTANQLWYGQAAPQPEVRLDIYLVLDESKLERTALRTLFEDIGAIGFGRDASIGLGKFDVAALEECALPIQRQANAWMTLAPCAPQELGFDPQRSFYQMFTRFGRHGDVGVHQGNPFKTPLLLAHGGAVLTPPSFQITPFVGQGLGGDGALSKSIPATVHQGFAPVVGLRLPDPEGS